MKRYEKKVTKEMKQKKSQTETYERRWSNNQHILFITSKPIPDIPSNNISNIKFIPKEMNSVFKKTIHFSMKKRRTWMILQQQHHYL